MLLPSPSAAQATYGSIIGTVTDASGAVIPNAAVTLTNTGTSERRTGASDGFGNYQFVNLIPGRYKVEAEAGGFKRWTRDQIAVEVQAAVRIDIRMEVGEVTQVTEVVAQTPLLQTQATSLSQVVEGRTVQEMPLNGRNVLNLTALVPGVVPQGLAMGSTAGVNVFAWGNYQIGGGMANQSASFLDGGPLNVNYANLTALVPSQDAVSEFRVQTNNLSPEFGRFTGGVINLSTKSGTNNFHGSAYEFFRNRSLNANNFFNNSQGQPRPAFSQNQYGVSLGGRIIRDKTFFFAAWEGFRLRQGIPYTMTVPTLGMRNGDFSQVYTSAAKQIVIYDPATTCGTPGNAACDSATTVKRTPFPGNFVPVERRDAIALKFMQLLFPLPNTPGNPLTGANNYTANASVGGDNDQYNFRIDQNVSDKQRIFGRVTFWNAKTLPKDPFRLKTYPGSEGPEYFNTKQTVIADTYVFSPNIIGDLRAAWLRFPFGREPEMLGFDVTKAGLPAYLNNLPIRTLPAVNVQGMSATGQVYIFARNDSISLAPSLTHIRGRHTFKYGGEIRRLTFNFTQVGSPVGQYVFDNLFTSANPVSPTVNGVTTGLGAASFLLGYGASGTLTVPSLTAGGMLYQGYYVNDTFQVNSKLTLNLGARWELPGPWTERFDRLTVFLPNTPNPIVPEYKGMIGLVKSIERPTRRQMDKQYSLIAPRVGIAYRVTDRFVVRTGYGIFYVPNDVTFAMSPYLAPINSITNTWASTLDSSLTRNATLANPFPSGILQPPGRDPSYQRTLLGQAINAGTPIPSESVGYMQQWNFNVQRELVQGFLLEVGYAGSKGVHLSGSGQTAGGGNGQQIDQLPDQYLSMGSALLTRVPNPFFGKVLSGTLASSTVQQGQLLRPYPQYNGVTNASAYNRDSQFHSLQAKLERRFRNGGVILASYAWSKNISNTDTTTGWLESPNVGGGGTPTQQNNNNHKLEKSLSSFDVSHRLVLSYVIDLPFGKGRRFMNSLAGPADKLLSGWGLNGVTTFQAGFPLKFTTATNLTNSFGGGSRPNVAYNCERLLTTPPRARLGKWFDTGCFFAPPSFTFGTASRTDPVLRAHGQNNFDMSLFKNTQINERFGVQFRAEFFNIFNRVQFGFPGQSLGVSQFGVVSSQANQPRLVQFALRVLY
jgi:hypothetical protein